MAWLILGHRLILNQSQPLTGHSPFHIGMERIRIPNLQAFNAQVQRAVTVGRKAFAINYIKEDDPFIFK